MQVRTKYPFQLQTARYISMSLLIQNFYIGSLIFIFIEQNSLTQSMHVQSMQYIPWLNFLSCWDHRNIVSVLTPLWLGVGLLGIFFWYSRYFRIIFFIALLFADGFLNSMGKINNGMTAWVWASFFLSLMPDLNQSADRTSRQKSLLFFQATQAAVVLPYTLSAIWKLKSCYEQWLNNEVHAFSVGAFSRLIAANAIHDNHLTVVGQWLVDHPFIAQGIYVPVIFIQLLALPVIFLGRLQPILGILLILFHIGTLLIMRITFPIPIFLLCYFFVLSPFNPKRVKIWIS